jgi:hypothetical protein
MPYATITRSPLPLPAYRALHAAISAAANSTYDGLISHVIRETEDGYDMFEVWESKEHHDAFVAKFVVPVLAQFDVRPTDPQPEFEDFEPANVMVIRTYP